MFYRRGKLNTKLLSKTLRSWKSNAKSSIPY